MISQVINLSNNISFSFYREKYKYSEILYNGLHAVEIRNVPSELLVDSDIYTGSNVWFANGDILVVGSLKEILNCLPSLQLNEKIKSEVAKALQNFEKSEVNQYSIGSRNFDFKYAYTMGILNVTPDSFSDGGKYINTETAVSYALEMIEDGADIIDVGGESTRPGSEPVNESQEIDRVVPVISELKKKSPEAVFSIDTTKANVARAALNSGASIVNDISGGTFDPQIFNVVNQFNAAMVIMHIKGKPKSMQDSPTYNEVVSEVYDFLSTQSSMAEAKGVMKLIVDPGIGFGKRTEHNLSLIKRLEDFKSLGLPIMIGLSRKSFIGNILNLQIEDRDDASNALNSIAMAKGARLIRTHNVKQAVQSCKLFNSLVN